MFAGLATTDIVVGRHETYIIVAFEAAVDYYHWYAVANRFRDGPAEGDVIKRGKDNPVDPTGDEIFHHPYLGLAVVFLERAFPDDLDAQVAQLLLGLDGTGVNGFPENVRGALRNNGNTDLCLAIVALPATADNKNATNNQG